MKFLIIGQSGLIGSALRANSELSYLDLHINQWQAKSFKESLEKLILQSNLNKNGLKIIWAAGISNIESSTNILDDEIGLIKDFLKVISKFSELINSLSFISSAGSIYGGCDDEIITEETLPNPITNYGKSRLTIEDSFINFGIANSTSIRIFRLSNVFGMKKNINNSSGLILNLIKANMLRKNINIFVPLTTTQDYIDVEFVSKNILSILTSTTADVVDVQKYILSRNYSHSIVEILSIIDKFLRRKTPYLSHPIDSTIYRQSNLRFGIDNSIYISNEIEPITFAIHNLIQKTYSQLKIN